MEKTTLVHQLRQDLADLTVMRGDLMASVGTIEGMMKTKREQLAEIGEEEVVEF